LKTLKICLFLVSASLLISLSSFAQNNTAAKIGSLPPPVTIEYSLAGTPQTGTPLAITIKVNSPENIPLRIKCLLPRGVMPVREPGVKIIPYRERHMPDMKRRKGYAFAVDLWMGSLKAGEPKTFTFHVTIPQKGSYNIICLAGALAKYGQKEQGYTLIVN